MYLKIVLENRNEYARIQSSCSGPLISIIDKRLRDRKYAVGS